MPRPHPRASPDHARPIGSSVVIVRPPLGPERVARLCDGATAALRTARAADLSPGLVCLVGQDAPDDLTTVDALARLALAARRSDAPTAVRGASNGLRDLLDFVGLAAVLPCDDDSSAAGG